MENPETQNELNFGDMILRRIGADCAVSPYITRWLVDGLILFGGTFMISGPPKTGKTWLVIELAVSAASGKPFLGRINVESGPVMIYSPEGPTAELVDRIRQVCARKGIDPESLALFIVEKKQLFLDSKVDQETIRASIEKVRPVLVVFDPMAECFDGDENRSDDVKVMSRFLNATAKEFDVAIGLSHHSTKDGASMRGSGALKAFGDSYLYLEKSKSGEITLTNEQRHGTPAPSIGLELKTVDGNTAYVMTEDRLEETKTKDKTDEILAYLKKTGIPASQRQMRQELKGKASAYPGYLKELKDANLIGKVNGLWQLKKGGSLPVPSKNGSKKREPGTALEGGSQRLAPIGREGNRTGPEKQPKSFISRILWGEKG